MDELERAGRALRETVAGTTGPSDRLRARAHAIVRHRRVLLAASVATVVIAGSLGIGLVARAGNGLRVHTIGPAASSTSLVPTTTHVVPTTPTTAGIPNRSDGPESPMPELAFVDSLHGWRATPFARGLSIEFTADGGRSWSVQARIPANNDTNSVEGIVGVDRRHAFALAFAGYTEQGAALPTFLLRTTNGSQWTAVRARGLDAPLYMISFSDPLHGWGVTDRDALVTTNDAGANWKTMTQPAARAAAVVCLSSPGAGWAATSTAVYRSDDNGASWVRQATTPIGGGTELELVCRGDHAAYASFDIGANQYTGGFLRTDDGGAHWRVLTQDRASGTTTVTAAGFPSLQTRGDPESMSADGTLAFVTGCSVCEPNRNWVVFAGPTDRFVEGLFDGNAAQLRNTLAAQAVDATRVFAEVQAVATGGNGPNPVSLYASVDGGRTWQLRWSGQ
jgi:photosystem II stability/assembly factor-like uncharacterized protein